MPEQGGSWKKAPKQGPKQDPWVASSKPGDFTRKQQGQLTVAFLFAVLLTSLAYFVIVLLRTKDPLPLLAVAVTEYSEQIPPNALAKEDIQRLDAVLGKSYDNVNLEIRESFTGGPQDFVKFLKDQMTAENDFKPGGPDEDTVAVYISAHGVIDQDGAPCLLLTESQVNDSETWLPISQLLKPFADLDQDVKKILFLEAGKIESNWMLGQIYNGFADRLESTVNSADVKNLRVIVSHSPGERSFISLKKGCSIFADAVANALRGAAISDSGSVDLQSCAAEVRRSVRDWSLSNRSRPQTPRLLPADAPNFSVAHVSDYKVEDIAAYKPIQFSARTEKVRNRWNEYDELQKTFPYKSDPINWSRLQHKLLYLQKAAVAGEAYETAFENTAVDINEIMTHLRGFAKITPFQGSTLSLTNALRETNSDKLKNAEDVWAAWKNPPEGEERKPLKPEKKLDYIVAANVVWNDLLATTNLQNTDIVTALDFLRVQAKPAGLDAPEIHFVRLLNDWADWPVSKVAPFLRLRKKYFDTEVPQDIRSHYRLDAFFQGEFGAQFRTHEDSLFYSPTSKELDRLTDNLLVELAKAKGLSDELSKAYAVRDRIWATVPFFAKWTLSRHVQFEKGDREKTVASLDKLLESNRRLDTLLRNGLSNEDSLMEEEAQSLRDLTNSIEQAEKEVDTRFKSRVEDLRSGDIRAKFAEMGDVIENPLLSQESRGDLYQKYVRFLNSDQKPTAQDENDDDADESKQFVEWLTVERSGVAAATLPLRILSTKSDPSKAGKHDARIGEIAAYGEGMRSRMSSLGEAFAASRSQTDVKKGESLAGDRRPLEQSCSALRQAVPISTAHAWNVGKENPVKDLHGVDTYGYILWQGEQRRLDAWGSGQNTDATAFFFDSVKKHIAASKAYDPDEVIERDYSKVLSAENNKLLLEFEPKQAAQKKLPTLFVNDVVLPPRAVFAEHAIQFLKLAENQEGSASVFVTGSSSQIELHTSRDDDKKTRRRLKATVDSKVLRFLMAAADINRNKGFKAKLFYRGHIRQRPFLGEEPKGEFLAIPRSPSRPVRIQVTQKSIPYEIVFVVDCSLSMAAPIGGETMMKKAIASVRDVVYDLLDRNQQSGTQFSVAVVAYGHRWSYRDRNRKVQREPVLNDNFPNAPRRVPVDDVETIVPMQLLDEDHLDRIDFVLSRLEPWGETPLHFAVQEAMHSFKFPKGRRDIIVITDGANVPNARHFGDKFKGARNPYRTNSDFIQQVLTDPRGRFQADKYLHLKYLFYRQNMASLNDEKLAEFERDLEIFKYGREVTDENDRKKAEKEGTGNSEGYRLTFDNADAQMLKSEINRVLKPSFTVRGIGTDFEDVGRVDEAGITIDNKLIRPTNKDNFTVHLTDQTIAGAVRSMLLRGGELVKLEYDPIERELAFKRFDLRIDPAVVQPVIPEFEINSHIIDRAGKSATFKISVQQKNPKIFTVRPNAIWAEIIPIFGKDELDESRAFYLYDVRLDSLAWAPLFQLTVGNWPDGAEKAEIRFSFGFRGNPKSKLIRINTNDVNVRIPEKKLGDVRLEFKAKQIDNSFQLIMSEKHPNKQSYPWWVRVDPEPDNIRRTFLGKNSWVDHLFEYNDSRGNLGDSIEVRIARPKDFINEWHNVPPFRARVDPRN